MTREVIPLDNDEFYGRIADDLMSDDDRAGVRIKIVQLRDAEKIASRVKKWLEVPGVKEALQRRPAP